MEELPSARTCVVSKASGSGTTLQNVLELTRTAGPSGKCVQKSADARGLISLTSTASCYAALTGTARTTSPTTPTRTKRMRAQKVDGSLEHEHKMDVEPERSGVNGQ